MRTNEALIRCCSSETNVDETFEITDDDVLAEREKALRSDPDEY